jgi:release factor glutamine methyltransferase
LADATTVAALVAQVEDVLAGAGVPTPQVDAELLVGHVTGLSRAQLALEATRSVGDAERSRLEGLVARRAAREPLQYVLGEWGFRRLTLTADRRALVPRPETEVVVERGLALLAGRERPRVLDVGTGSGAIALAIADEHPGARVTGVDASEGALALARENAARTGLELELRRHDLFTGLPAGPWELVVSNPPYVEPGELHLLEPEVRTWEPHAALVGHGATEAVARGARDVLGPGGGLVLEVADGTADSVGALLDELGYRDVRATADLTGRDRVVEGVRSGTGTDFVTSP